MSHLGFHLLWLAPKFQSFSAEQTEFQFGMKQVYWANEAEFGQMLLLEAEAEGEAVQKNSYLLNSSFGCCLRQNIDQSERVHLWIQHWTRAELITL